MDDGKKLVKMQDDDLIIVELDCRSDMSILDPLGFNSVNPIIVNGAGCGNIFPTC